MREKRLTILIHRPASAVFAFTTDPANTPKWIANIVEEQVNGWPIQLGTKYRNRDQNGQWTEYAVSAVAPDQVFQLSAVQGDYTVRYTYRAVDQQTTELVYHEWVESGDLDNPFEQSALDELKRQMER